MHFLRKLLSIILLTSFAIVVPTYSHSKQAGEIDLTFESDGSVDMFKAADGSVWPNSGTLEYTFIEGSNLTSPDLTLSRNGIYNQDLKERNTMFFVMENRSSADKIKISFITNSDSEYNEEKSKIFDMEPNSSKRAYFFNFSDNPHARGRIKAFRIEPLGGSGKLLIDRITFEQEAVIEPFAGRVFLCTADKKNITIKGRIHSEYLENYDKISIYETSMALQEDDIRKMEKLAEMPIERDFEVNNIPFKNGYMTRLSSQFIAVVENSRGDFLKVGPRFYIKNWRDFENNPYEFKLSSRSVKVTDFGAKGDAFTDDTDAIQAAIDDVSSKGGGKVVLPGDNSFYGRRYIATNIQMKSNVELNIERGAILWQSQDPKDYKYEPEYGHESEMRDISWAHSLHVSNLPFIQAKSVENIKVTGPGKIRSMDPPSEDEAYHKDNYERYCKDKIHIIPFGFWDTKNIEVSDIDLVRTNNYHASLYDCRNIFFGNIKMYEVQCVSGDGIGLGVGSSNAKIVRMFLESNDDGVTLYAGYNDPRGILWWRPNPEGDNTIRNVVVCSSYISSGGGKAIAFIPWGSSNPDLSKSEIDSLFVYDCVLSGGYSVGTWPDNPFYGRMPFDNTEEDDYSPIKNIRIWNNKYLSPCDLLCVKPTNFISDCGIKSSSEFVNGDFSDGHSYWTMEGVAGVKDGAGYTSDGRLYEGLYLEKGNYIFSAQVKDSGNLFVENANNSRTVKKMGFTTNRWEEKSIKLSIPADNTYYLGISGKDAKIRKAEIRKLD